MPQTTPSPAEPSSPKSCATCSRWKSSPVPRAQNMASSISPNPSHANQNQENQPHSQALGEDRNGRRKIRLRHAHAMPRRCGTRLRRTSSHGRQPANLRAETRTRARWRSGGRDRVRQGGRTTRRKPSADGRDRSAHKSAYAAGRRSDRDGAVRSDPPVPQAERALSLHGAYRLRRLHTGCFAIRMPHLPLTCQVSHVMNPDPHPETSPEIALSLAHG